MNIAGFEGIENGNETLRDRVQMSSDDFRSLSTTSLQWVAFGRCLLLSSRNPRLSMTLSPSTDTTNVRPLLPPAATPQNA